jgi:hypothetical protein
MKVLVLHDSSGKIKSITQVNPDAKFGVSVAAPKGHTVNELELPTELRDVALHSLHKTHRVDLKTKSIVPAPAETVTKRAKSATKKKK